MDALSAVLKGSRDTALEKVLAFASQNLEPGMAAAFIEGLKALRGKFTQKQLENLILRGPEALAHAIVGVYSSEEVFDALRDSVQGAMAKSAKYFKDSSRISLRFNAYHPTVVQAAEAQTYALIQQIGEVTRAGIKTYVSASLTAGTNPRETARQIRGIIGLTDRQARAVFNYRRFLEQGDPQALERALRDHRSDTVVRRAIEGNKKLPKAYVDGLVDKYERRYINYRAEVISRTEALDALHKAQDLLWEQALEDGKIPWEDMVRKWYIGPGERTCPICREIPTLNPDGVGLGQVFQIPGGTAMAPPVHPQCRCVVFTRPRIRRAAA